MSPKPDVIVIGGGVIGLSSAWALSKTGLRVEVYDRRGVTPQASWIGVGVLSPLTPWFCAPELKPLPDDCPLIIPRCLPE